MKRQIINALFDVLVPGLLVQSELPNITITFHISQMGKDVVIFYFLAILKHFTSLIKPIRTICLTLTKVHLSLLASHLLVNSLLVLFNHSSLLHIVVRRRYFKAGAHSLIIRRIEIMGNEMTFNY